MFRQHFFAREERGFGRGEHGPMGHGCRGRMGGFGGHRGHGEREFGGGRERMFEGGDLRLVILNLLAEKPSYGYEIIKRMEEQLSGGYAPSPGVVYPTLTMLEEEGFTEGATENGKKVFRVTEAGQAYLLENGRRLKEIHERLEHAGGAFQRGRSPQIMRAFLNLRSAVKAKATRGKLSAEQISKIAEAIDAAAKSIDAL